MNFNNIYRENILHVFEDTNQKNPINSNRDITNRIIAKYKSMLNTQSPFSISEFLSKKVFDDENGNKISANEYLAKTNTSIDRNDLKEALQNWVKLEGFKSFTKAGTSVAIVENVLSHLFANSIDPTTGNYLVENDDLETINKLIGDYKVNCIQDDFTTFVNGLLENGSTWKSGATGGIEQAIKDVGGSDKIYCDSKDYLRLFKAIQEKKFIAWKEKKGDSILTKSLGDIYSNYISENKLKLEVPEQKVLLALIKDSLNDESKRKEDDEHVKAGTDRIKEKYGEIVGRHLRTTLKPSDTLNFEELKKIKDFVSNTSDDFNDAFQKAVLTVYNDNLDSDIEKYKLFTWSSEPENAPPTDDVDKFNEELCKLIISIKNEYGIPYIESLKTIYNIENSKASNTELGKNRWDELGKELTSIITQYNNLMDKDDYYKKLSMKSKLGLANDIGRNSMNALQAIGVVTSLVGAGIGAYIPGGTLISPLITGVGKWLRRGGKFFSNKFNTLERKKEKDKFDVDEEKESERKRKNKKQRKEDKDNKDDNVDLNDSTSSSTDNDTFGTV